MERALLLHFNLHIAHINIAKWFQAVLQPSQEIFLAVFQGLCSGALISMKEPLEFALQPLWRLVPMVSAASWPDTFWHMSHIVMAEEGQLLEPLT